MLANFKLPVLMLLATGSALLTVSAPAQIQTKTEPDTAHPALRGKIKHWAVAELPVPRDRTAFGIGEDVDFWIEPPDGEGPEALIAWHANGGNVYPIVGTGTRATVALASMDGMFEVLAARRDTDMAIPEKKSPTKASFREWLSEQIASLPKGQQEPGGNEPPPAPEYAKDLRDALFRLDGLRNGIETPFAQVEELGHELLRKHPAPKERGQIYYRLAHVHAQSGLVHPDRVVVYAKKALEHPLERLQVPELYVYWGDAVQVAHAKESLAARRKLSAVIYLAGLHEVLRYALPAKVPELPAVEGGVDPRWRAELVAARRLAKYQIAMLHHREVLIRQAANLYHGLPAAPEELRDLAEGVLRNPWAVDRFLRAVKSGRWEE